MFCTNCGKQLRDDANFCCYCGSSIKGRDKTTHKTVVEVCEIKPRVLKKFFGGDKYRIEVWCDGEIIYESDDVDNVDYSTEYAAMISDLLSEGGTVLSTHQGGLVHMMQRER